RWGGSGGGWGGAGGAGGAGDEPAISLGRRRRAGNPARRADHFFHPESLVPRASQRPAPAAPPGAGRSDAAMDDGTDARGRGGTGPGTSARVAGRRRARHLVRPGARRAVAGPVAALGHAVVGTRGAHQQPVGPLVETARMRALPVGGGDAAR